MKIKKLVSIAAAICITGTGIAVGGNYIWKKQLDSIMVEVVPVSDIMTYNDGASVYMSGSITNRARQAVYMSESQNIKNILVKEGQQIKSGTQLVELDTTKNEIELEQLRLQIQQKCIEISNGLNKLNRLVNTKPYVPPAEGDFGGYDDYYDEGYWGEEESTEEESTEEESSEEESTEEESTEEAGTEEAGTEESSIEEETQISEEGVRLICDSVRNLEQAQSGDGQKDTPYVFYTAMNARIDIGILSEITQKKAYAQVWVYNEQGKRCYILDFSLILILSQMEEEPQETQPQETQPQETQPQETQPQETQPQETQPQETQPQETQPQETQPQETQPQETQPQETQPQETQPQETQPQETQPQETQPSGEVQTVSDCAINSSDSVKLLYTDESSILKLLDNNASEVGIDMAVKSLSQTDGDITGITDIELPTEDTQSYEYYSADELKQAIHEQEVSLRDMDLERRKMELSYVEMENELNSQEIVSHIDGKVIEMQDSDKIDYSRPLMVIDSGKGFFVEGTVSEDYLDQFKAGSSIECSIYQEDNFLNFSATVIQVSEYPAENTYGYVANENASNYSFIAQAEDETGLENGMYADIRYNVPENESGIYIEKMYVRRDNAGYYVWAANKDTDLLEKRYVKIGKTLYDSYYEIKEGITEDDAVAFPFGKDIKEGVKTRSYNEAADGQRGY